MNKLCLYRYPSDRYPSDRYPSLYLRRLVNLCLFSSGSHV